MSGDLAAARLEEEQKRFFEERNGAREELLREALRLAGNNADASLQEAFTQTWRALDRELDDQLRSRWESIKLRELRIARELDCAQDAFLEDVHRMREDIARADLAHQRRMDGIDSAIELAQAESAKRPRFEINEEDDDHALLLGLFAAQTTLKEVTNALLQSRVVCIVCLDAVKSTLLEPCLHMACCHACSSQLTQCPVCRSPIDRATPVHSA